jgi:hypothetical protein
VLESDFLLQSSPELEELLWASAAPSSLLLSLASSLEELSYSPLRTPTNCRLLGPGLGWAPGVPSFFFIMDLRMPGRDQMRVLSFE